jgi:hypothetical protein
MEDFLKQLVEEDTIEAWQALKDQMPWNFAGEDDSAVAALGFEEAEIDLEDPEEVAALLDDHEEGTVWMETYLDPGLYIGEDFMPYLVHCQQIICLPKGSKPSSATALFIAKSAKTADMQDYAISLLIVACPRCQLLYTQGDDDVDFDTDIEDWIDQECPACEGTGEWEYELQGL